jgi:predicted transcriptional regulator
MKPLDFYGYQKDNRLSQVQMAKKIGVSPITYSDYIKKKPKKRAMRQYAKNKFIDFYNEHIKKTQLDLLKPTPVKAKLTVETENVYLETAEEIINELSAGSVIHISNDSSKTFKMVDGIIVCFVNNNPISINPAILCSEKYYIVRKIPLKLEVGKRYITKTEQTVTIFNRDDQKFHGVVDGRNGFISFYPDGVSCIHSDLDLIGEK